MALSLARLSPHLGSQSKWRTVGDRALASWKVGLAEECFKQANDLSALLLIYTSTGDRLGLEELSRLAGTSFSFPPFLQNHSLTLPLFVLSSRLGPNQHLLRLFPPTRRPLVLCGPPPRNGPRTRSCPLLKNICSLADESGRQELEGGLGQDEEG